MSQYKIQHQAVQWWTPALQRQEPFGQPIIEPEWLEWAKKNMARRQLARLEIAKRKILAQMNGHRGAAILRKDKFQPL